MSCHTTSRSMRSMRRCEFWHPVVSCIWGSFTAQPVVIAYVQLDLFQGVRALWPGPVGQSRPGSTPANHAGCDVRAIHRILRQFSGDCRHQSGLSLAALGWVLEVELVAKSLLFGREAADIAFARQGEATATGGLKNGLRLPAGPRQLPSATHLCTRAGFLFGAALLARRLKISARQCVSYSRSASGLVRYQRYERCS